MWISRIIAAFHWSDLLICVLFCSVVVGVPRLALRLRRRYGWSVFALRKAVHMVTAVLFVPVVLGLEGRGWGVVLTAGMIAMNLQAVLGRRFRSKSSGALGVVILHAAALVVLTVIWLGTDFRRILFPILVLGIGDATAALVGRWRGWGRLAGFRPGKTLSGMIGGLLVAGGVIVVCGRAIGIGEALPLWRLALPAAAVLIEPFLPGDWDNPALLILAGGMTLWIP